MKEAGSAMPSAAGKSPYRIKRINHLRELTLACGESFLTLIRGFGRVGRGSIIRKGLMEEK